MFLDASAIIAIIARESDAAVLMERLRQADEVHTSPIAMYETALGLARLGKTSIQDAQTILDRFLGDARAQIMPIGPEMGRSAIAAFDRYGRGRHPAGLNMGDCLRVRPCSRYTPVVQGRRFPFDRYYDRLRGLKGRMTIFFTSDTHFGHGGALGLYRRPFASVAAMNEALVEQWNETVGPDDVVWHLGDFAIRQRPEIVAELLARLGGRKHLVAGNNDPPATRELDGWESVQPYAEIAAEEVSLVLCHYPFRSWRGMGKGWVNLHGHSHGRLKPLPRQVDVGVDVWGFRPVTLEEILHRRR